MKHNYTEGHRQGHWMSTPNVWLRQPLLLLRFASEHDPDWANFSVMADSTPDYEFFGPYVGPIAIVLGLPAICIGLVAACNQSGCTDWSLNPPRLPDDWRLFDHRASVAVLGWILFQACLWLVIPGKKAQGVVLTDGRRLTYKLTGKGWAAGSAAS